MNCPDRRVKSPVAPFVSLFLCLLAGCAVDQKKEVGLYRTVIDGKNPPGYVYHLGEPLSPSARALILSNQSDEQLASGGETYLQALIDKERQFATFLPTVSLAPTYSWVNRRGASAISSAGAVSVVKLGITHVPVTGSYNVFNGFQDVANYRRSGIHLLSSRIALLLDLQQTILLNVAQAYYSVLTNERSVTVLLNSVELQNDAVRDMGRAGNAWGLARPLDVAQSEAQAAATRVQLIQAQNNVRTGRIALAFLTSAPVEDAPLEDRLSVPDAFASQDELTKFAIRLRQDVQAGRSAIEAARQSVQSAIGQYYPSVTLNLDYLLHKESVSTASIWESVLSANIPIFTGGVIDANVRAAWSQLRQAWLNDQRNHRQVSEQVRTAYENLQGSKKRVRDLHIEVAAARDALQQAQFSYNAGLATNLDVLTAIDALNSAELSLNTEELNYKVFYLQLLRSQGTLSRPDSPLPPPGAPVSQPSIEEVTSPGAATRRGANGAATQPTTAPATQPEK